MYDEEPSTPSRYELASELTQSALAAIRRSSRRALHERRLRSGSQEAWQRPLAAGRWTLLTILVVASTTVLIGWLLWRVAGQTIGPARVNAELSAARIALAAGGGAGAGIGLLFAFRRQRHHEIDAREQRITELYINAVEHLGASEAPVRLGALHALARLGQENIGEQRTIADVICAYLRMPFPAECRKSSLILPAPHCASTPGGIEAVPTRPSASSEMANEVEAPAWTLEQWKQEREVRITAQRLLGRHLDDGTRWRFWGYTSLDLNGATLFDFQLNGGVTTEMSFAGATFVGETSFTRTSTRSAIFERAQFLGEASFAGASFNWDAKFSNASFYDRVRFDGTKFNGCAVFCDVQFQANARFAHTNFGGECKFDGTVFNEGAGFNGATFDSPPSCRGALTGHGRGISSWPESWKIMPTSGQYLSKIVDESRVRGSWRLPDLASGQ